MNTSKQQVKLVKWRDSHRYMYQIDRKEEVDFTIIKTVGFFVSSDKDKIVLAQDIIDDDIRGVIVIPKENIIEIKSVKDLK